MSSTTIQPDFIDHLGKYGSTAEGANTFFDAVNYAAKYAIYFVLDASGQETARKVATFADTTSAAMGWSDLLTSGNDLRRSVSQWACGASSKATTLFKKVILDSSSVVISVCEGVRALAIVGIVGISSSSPVLSAGASGGFLVTDSIGIYDAVNELQKDKLSPEDAAIEKTKLVKHSSRFVVAVLGFVSLVYAHALLPIVTLFSATVSLLAKTRLFSLMQSKKDAGL